MLQRLLDGNVPKSAGSFHPLPPPLQLAVGKLRQNEAGHGASPIDGNMLREVCSIAQQMLKVQTVPAVAAIRGECVVIAGDQHRPTFLLGIGRGVIFFDGCKHCLRARRMHARLGGPRQ